MPALDLDRETMRRLGHHVADVVAEHLSTLREQPAFHTLDRADAERRLAGPPPVDGTDLEAIVARLREDVFPYAAREPHPRFLAYVPGCPTFPAVLGDWLATGFNFFAGVWPVAAGPNEVELVVLDWFREWLGMPAGTMGLLTSGGSTATLMAMVAARHEAVGEDAARIARLTVYMSDQTHSAAIRAAWIAGIPRANVRLLPVEDDFRVRAESIEDAIAEDRAAGREPLMIVANAGTTNTGAVDPLPELAELAAREQVWLHIDAAFGGFAVLTERGRAMLAGIERADSVAMDPHKWLYVPFECGCLLAREPRRLKAAFQIYPDYLKDVEAAGAAVNFADYGEQLTRYARALKVWINVHYYGMRALREAIAHGLELPVHAERAVRADPLLEVLAPATFAVLCFRAHPPGLEDPEALDALNERINARIVADGRWFISTTRLRGALSLRICPIGHRTRVEDVLGLVAEVGRLAREE